MREMSKPEAHVDSLQEAPTGTSESRSPIDDIENEENAEDDDEEDGESDGENEDMALLKAEADEITIDDGNGIGSDATAVEHFKARLAFANRRTKTMTSQQYLGYSRAREAHFLANKELVEKFKSWYVTYIMLCTI